MNSRPAYSHGWAATGAASRSPPAPARNSRAPASARRLRELPLPFSTLSPVAGHAIGKRISSFALAYYRRRDTQEFKP